MKKKRKRKRKQEKVSLSPVQEHLEECLKNPKFKKIYYEGIEELQKAKITIWSQIKAEEVILEYTFKENEYWTPFKYWRPASLLGISRHLHKG